MAENEWVEFDGRSTIGLRGSEEGTTIKDEEHPLGARITLERDTRTSPYSITCGIYGWIVHTRFFGSGLEASQSYEEMKLAITEILSTSAAQSDEDNLQKTHHVSDTIDAFVKRFP